MSLAPVETLIVTDGAADERVLREAAPTGSATVVPLSSGVEHVLRLLEARPPSLLVISCGSSSDELLGLVREARRRHDEAAIVMLYGGSPNGFMERAFQIGADDLITLPQSPEALTFAFEKALTRRRGATPSTAAPLICVVGPKGGTGKTLTACNLAVALARDGARPVIVDIDLQFGDVGLALGLRPERTIYDLVISGGGIDAGNLDHFVTRHSSGVRALLAPIRPDQAGAVSVEFLRQLYTSLRDNYGVVVIDTPPSFTSEVIASIDAATDICVVGMLDALSLKDTKIGLETLSLMGVDLDDLTIVLNRADTSVGISMRDVERLLGRLPDILIPSDLAIPRAITEGVPIVLADPDSGAARAFDRLASIYLHRGERDDATTNDAGPRGGRRSLLRRGR